MRAEGRTRWWAMVMCAAALLMALAVIAVAWPRAAVPAAWVVGVGLAVLWMILAFFDDRTRR